MVRYTASLSEQVDVRSHFSTEIDKTLRRLSSCCKPA